MDFRAVPVIGLLADLVGNELVLYLFEQPFLLFESLFCLGCIPADMHEIQIEESIHDFVLQDAFDLIVNAVVSYKQVKTGIYG